MTFRLVEILVPAPSQGAIESVLEDHSTLARWVTPLDEERVRLTVLLGGEAIEPTVQALEEKVEGITDARLLLLPVEATLPRPDEQDAEEDGEGAATSPEEPNEGAVGPAVGPARLSTAELYQDVVEMTELSGVHLGLVFLSTIVAAFGLLEGDIAVIVGAMVIAPLLGPNVGLSLATTLADGKLARKAVLTATAGLLVSIGAAFVLGTVLPVDPAAAQIAPRTSLGLEQIALALAAGGAAVLSLTVGVSTALVGVMVAVALLPPIAAAGMLAGDGHLVPALGAFLLAVSNLISINLAGVLTFLVQGVRPTTYWEAERAKRSTAAAIVLWTIMLALLVFLILQAPGIGIVDPITP